MIQRIRSTFALILGLLVCLALWMPLFPRQALAQSDNCDEVIRAYNVATESCTRVRSGYACYGISPVDTELIDDKLTFSSPEDQVKISELKSLTTRDKGAALIKADTAEGDVTIFAFGGVGLDPLTGESFVLHKQGPGLVCERSPSGLLIQTPKGESGKVTINGLAIRLGSTAFIETDGGLLFDQNPRVGRRSRGFTIVTDETGIITLSVPESWTDVQSEPVELESGELAGFQIYAAPDVEDYKTTWGIPGVNVEVWEDMDGTSAAEWLDVSDYDRCTYGGRSAHNTEHLEGVMDIWMDCGDIEGSILVEWAAKSTGTNPSLISLDTLVATPDDLAIVDNVINSLNIGGTGASTEQGAMLSCGFDSACGFGDSSCEINEKILSGPYCGESNNTFSSPGLYRINLYGTGRVGIDARDHGQNESQFSLTQVDFALSQTEPSGYAFCWAASNDWETVVTARSLDASVDRMTVEFLGENCATAGTASAGNSRTGAASTVMTVTNIEGTVEVNAPGEPPRPIPEGEALGVDLSDPDDPKFSDRSPNPIVVDSPVVQTLTTELPSVSAVPEICTNIPLSTSNNVVVRFVNESDSVAIVNWINFDNQEQEYKRLEPSESYDQGTFDTHQWIVKDPNGAVLLEYTASDEPTQCVRIP